jgi:hypothetical protein
VRTLSPPGVWHDGWQCAVHGEVYPLSWSPDPSADWVRAVAARSTVPVWLPWPLPSGWVVDAVVPVGDEVTGGRGAAVVVNGPNPFGGPLEVVLVSEEPGVGLGARLAGLAGVDAGDAVRGAPYTRIDTGRHQTPLWMVPCDDDMAVAVGEQERAWLWLILKPATAGPLLLSQDLTLADVRDLGEEVRLLPYGAKPAWVDALISV